MNLHSQIGNEAGAPRRRLFSTGSARALACIGRRLADRNGRAKSVFGGAPNTTREGACAPRNEAVALVITLLMLSVITFLTIAFLALSQRNQTAVSASLDESSARAMSDAALARAQAEILAEMMAHGDPLYYNYKVSTAYQSPDPYDATEGTNNPRNVNYDSFSTNLAAKYSSADWAQNIANLQYDPRPPVFIVTNPAAYPNNSDFRFWVDINRNGRFETNGYQPTVDTNGFATGFYGFENGEPEFIGMLKNPLYPHSYTNQFIGRYAYLVLPIGKELDFNYIHNFLKDTYRSIGNLDNTSSKLTIENDGFARDQGIGSWELNLAGVLDAVSPWTYENITNNYPTPYSPYNYVVPFPLMGNSGVANTGNAFDDAEAILHYRYPPTPYLASLGLNFSNYTDFYSNYIDMYCQDAPVTAPFDYSPSNEFPVPNAGPSTNAWSWPGSYQTNLFFDAQDLFDTNKTSKYFPSRMIYASEQANTFDRYTFLRLLSCIGMGSSPEYGVWVYGDNDGFGPPSQLRTKVNINYCNTNQIQASNAPYALMPTSLVPWTPICFFTNAAELLLRSQTFMYSNIFLQPNGIALLGTPVAFPAHFGVTNIPIYRINNPGVRYDSSVHRMLQLAANIYDATVNSNYAAGGAALPPNLPPVRHPSIFRPIFGIANKGTTNAGINIIGYIQMTNNNGAVATDLSRGFYDLPTALGLLQASTANSNINIWGIPWVVGANQGLPQFYQYSYQSTVLYERKLLFSRYANSSGKPDTNRPPQFTNQFYCMWVSNNFGLDAWNPYPSNFPTSLSGSDGTTCYISNYITIELTNNYNFGFTNSITNVYPPITQGFAPFRWPGWGLKGPTDTNGFITFFQTNVTMLPPAYFSPTYNYFIPFTNGVVSSNGFLAVDTNQSSATTGYPVYNWTLNITNHVVYALFDGSPTSGALLDFVNLGPFGTSTNIQQLVASTSYNATSPGGTLGFSGGSSVLPPWTIGNATSAAKSPMSTGLINQLGTYYTPSSTYYNNLNGITNPPESSGAVFGAPFEPSNVIVQTVQYVANDPMVHYTLDDLTYLNANQASSVTIPVSLASPFPPLTNSLGKVNTQRYWQWNLSPTPFNGNMLFMDPQMIGATNWAFQTNKFPGIGWLGRVHRGTPWQTIYLKADNPSGTASPGINWINWANSPWFPGFEPMPETYPTNDWALVDLFTTAPDDNAARGLLSVNQTNDAAWAAVFAGVIAPTNSTNGIQIGPINDVYNLVDTYSTNYGINALRTNLNYQPNGLFHKVGDILAAPALTTQSPFLLGNGISPANCSDEIVERIPQQTLSLLKVGEPQFVIYSWGQSLKPKGPPYLKAGDLNNNIYTNYEITGEVLTRTVCHLVYPPYAPAPKMVIDSYNVETGSGN